MVAGSVNRKAWKYLGFGLVAGLALGGLTLFGLGLSGSGFDLTKWLQGKPRGPVVGRPAPDFELGDLDGQVIALSDRRGAPVLINFWATWCAPCVLEMPNIQKYYELYPGQFSVLAVNADEPTLEVQRFVGDLGLTFDILLDPGGTIQELYQIRGYPTTYFLDERGVIRFQHIGSLSEDQLAQYLSQLGIHQ